MAPCGDRGHFRAATRLSGRSFGWTRCGEGEGLLRHLRILRKCLLLSADCDKLDIFMVAMVADSRVD